MCSDDADPPHIELAPDRLVRISTASYLEMRQSIARLTAERDAWEARALIAEAQSDRRLMLDVIEQGIERYRGAIGVIRYLASDAPRDIALRRAREFLDTADAGTGRRPRRRAAGQTIDRKA